MARLTPHPRAFYNAVMMRVISAAVLCLSLAGVGRAQAPQPFPQHITAQTQRTAAQAPAPAPAAKQPATAGDANTPSAATLGVAIYPTAQFIGSYDAGLGQRYYLFGTTADFAELLLYYRGHVGERGDLVFKDPPTHMFTGGTLARYRDDTMAFPPSVTVKDWTSGGSPGYPNPRIGAQPRHFTTVIMIVPAPASAAPSR